jgi:hypothetical protein
MATKNIKGLKTNSRSPGSISNVEHYDQVGAEKSVSGSPGAIEKVIQASTSVEPLRNHDVLRVFNQSGTQQFLWIGPIDEEPVTVDATNGMALITQFTEVFYVGVSDDDKTSLAVKSSDNLVQVVVMKR